MNLYTLNLRTKEGREQLEAFISSICSSFGNQREKREELIELYKFYSGKKLTKSRPSDTVQEFNKKTGSIIINQANLKRYKLGLSKLRILINEFLSMNIVFSILSMDRDSNINRADRFKTLESLSLAKSTIETIQEEGYDVYSGMDVPDPDEMEDKDVMSIRLEHEVDMQRYIEEKELDKDLKGELEKQMVAVITTNHCFGKVEKGPDGKLTFRSIAPYNMVAPTTTSQWSDGMTYIGEMQELTLADILRSYTLEEEDIEELKKAGGTIGEGDNRRFKVFTVQFVNAGKPFYVKTENVNGKQNVSVINDKEFNRNRKKYLDQKMKGEIQLERVMKERVYEAVFVESPIAKVVSLSVVDASSYEDNEGKVRPNYDYLLYRCSLAGDEMVEPIASMIRNIDEDYDYIRHLIKIELNKPQGSYMAYDEGKQPKSVKSYNELIARMRETGEIRYNSSSDGNVSETDGNVTGVSSFTLGSIDLIIQMANYAMMLEQTADRITGLNDSRSGLTKANATATTSNNNLEASRTMTYDVFYHVQRFGERVMTLMCNKLKSHPYEVNPKYSESLMDENHYDRFIRSFNMTMASFKAFINDGRKDNAIIEYIKQTIFPQDIAAGKITSTVIANVLSKRSLVEFVDALQKSEEAFDKKQEQISRSNMEYEANLRKEEQDGKERIEQIRGENKLREIEAQGRIKSKLNSDQERLRNDAKRNIEQYKQNAQMRQREMDANYRHMDVMEASRTKLQSDMIKAEQKKDQKSSTNTTKK